MNSSPMGVEGEVILKIYSVFLVWRNEKVLEYRGVVWRSGGTGQLGEAHPMWVWWMPECYLPWPHSRSPTSALTARGPVRCPQERAFPKEVDEAGWKIENWPGPPPPQKNLWMSGKSVGATHGWIKSFGLYVGPPGYLVEMSLPGTSYQQETPETCVLSQRHSNDYVMDSDLIISKQRNVWVIFSLC